MHRKNTKITHICNISIEYSYIRLLNQDARKNILNGKTAVKIMNADTRENINQYEHMLRIRVDRFLTKTFGF